MKNQTPPHTLAPPLPQPVFTPLLRWLVFSLLAMFSFATQAGAAAPTVGPPTSADITYTTATLGGTLVDNGGDIADPVTSRGVVYSTTNTDPVVGTTLTDGSLTPNAVGAITVPITGLAPATTYYFQVFATNVAGTVRSTVGSFTTATPTAPTVISPTSANITHLAAELGGNVSADNGAPITARGVVYSSTTSAPALGQGVTTTVVEHATDSTGAFTVATGALTKGTRYYFSAYATNSVGTTYTTDTLPVSFFDTDSEPTVTTPTSTVTSTTAATLGGNVTLDNGATITERGVIYAKASDGESLNIDNVDGLTVFKATAAGTTGDFTVGVTGLEIGTEYDFVAYATNAVGTTYTAVGVFETTHVTPTIDEYPTYTNVATDTVTGEASATLGGNVTKSGAEFIERGVVYALDTVALNPAIGDGVSEQVVSDDISGDTGAFTVDVENLLPNRQYYFFAYVKNDKATVYNLRRGSFKTKAVAPVIDNDSVTEGVPSSTGVALGGEVTVGGGATITEIGIVYSVNTENSDPLLAAVGTTAKKATVTPPSSGNFTIGAYTKTLTGLQPFTTYAYKVYATNTEGTGYSAVGTFMTAAGAPTITSPSKASILVTSAKLGGNVTKSNGAAITERGVVYAITTENSNPEVGGANVTKKAATTAGTGVFTVAVTGLAPKTQYSFKAYAANVIDGVTTYSYTVALASSDPPTLASTFTTPAGKPTVESPTDSAVEAFTATLGGDVTSASGDAITERGVVYSISSTKPSLGNATSETKAGTTGAFTVGVTGLKPAKKYYYRAYAKNGKGVGYSAVGTFTTEAAAPSLNAIPLAPSDFIKATSAKLGARGIKANGSKITERGVVYSSTNSDPEVGGNGVKKKTTASTLSSFGIIVTGLEPDTKYFFKAYAKNEIGTTYTDVDFIRTDKAAGTLLAGAPVGSALAASASTETYYTVGAEGLKYLTIVISDAAQAPTVEVSGNLTDWFSGSSHTTVISDADGILKVRDNTPVTAGANRYIRVKP